MMKSPVRREFSSQTVTGAYLDLIFLTVGHIHPSSYARISTRIILTRTMGQYNVAYRMMT